MHLVLCCRNDSPPPTPWMTVTARRVVLAEDDADLRDMLASALRADGYDVIEAADGAELLAAVSRDPVGLAGAPAPAVIVTDIRMPGRSGLEVLADLRQAHVATPVIVITGFGDATALAEAKRLGVAAVFDKPFDLDDLRAAVRNLLKPP